jgi:hypothetical protein
MPRTVQEPAAEPAEANIATPMPVATPEPDAEATASVVDEATTIVPEIGPDAIGVDAMPR